MPSNLCKSQLFSIWKCFACERKRHYGFGRPTVDDNRAPVIQCDRCKCATTHEFSHVVGDRSDPSINFGDLSFRVCNEYTGNFYNRITKATLGSLGKN